MFVVQCTQDEIGINRTRDLTNESLEDHQVEKIAERKTTVFTAIV